MFVNLISHQRVLDTIKLVGEYCIRPKYAHNTERFTVITSMVKHGILKLDRVEGLKHLYKLNNEKMGCTLLMNNIIKNRILTPDMIEKRHRNRVYRSVAKKREQLNREDSEREWGV